MRDVPPFEGLHVQNPFGKTCLFHFRLFDERDGVLDEAIDAEHGRAVGGGARGEGDQPIDLLDQALRSLEIGLGERAIREEDSRREGQNDRENGRPRKPETSS